MYYYKEVKKPNRIFGKISLLIIRKYLQKKVDIYVEENDTEKIKPPYLILANHVTYWDPFLVNMFVCEPICYIAGAVYFRNPLLRFFLNSAGSIPKKKFMIHYSPIKRLIQARDHGRILGIFPEGERKWDGTTDEMTFHSTAKLIKKLNISVVAVKIKGGYLAYPRWAKFSRKGKINMAYKLCIAGDKIEKLSVKEIEDRIKEYLSHDEVRYQKGIRNEYKGDYLAEHLEHLLFVCPNCKSFNTLVSKENKLRCNQCNYGIIYNQLGFLEGLQEKLYFDNLRDWNRWQNGYLKEFIDRKLKRKDIKVILEDNPVDILEGSFGKPFRPIGQGKLCLEKRDLYFYFFDGREYQFRLRQISGLNVQFHAVLEFNYKQNMYRFTFHNQHISSYKWVQAIHYVRDEITQYHTHQLGIAGSVGC